MGKTPSCIIHAYNSVKNLFFIDCERVLLIRKFVTAVLQRNLNDLIYSTASMNIITNLKIILLTFIMYLPAGLKQRVKFGESYQ